MRGRQETVARRTASSRAPQAFADAIIEVAREHAYDRTLFAKDLSAPGDAAPQMTLNLSRQSISDNLPSLITYLSQTVCSIRLSTYLDNRI